MGLQRNGKNLLHHGQRILRGERRFSKLHATFTTRRRHPDDIVHSPQDEDAASDGDPAPPLQRNAANARERARMRVLSRAFCRLKTCLPWVPPDTKLSKLDTLRLAATYIAHLTRVLGEEEEQQTMTADSATHPLALTWPFTISSRSTYGECTTAVQESCRMTSSDYSPDSATDYRSLVPCEYLATNQPGCLRREAVGHYLQ